MSASNNSGVQNTDWGATPMRQAAVVRPVDQGNPPRVATAVGFGAGGGAFIRNQGGDADAAQGLVVCRFGLGAAVSGTVTLQFPQATPAAAGGMFCAAAWASLVVTQGNPLTIAWTVAGNPIGPGEHHAIAYQWNNPV